MTNDTDPKFTAYKEKGQRLGPIIRIGLFLAALFIGACIGGLLFLLWSAK